MNEISYWLKQLLIETWITFQSFTIITQKSRKNISASQGSPGEHQGKYSPSGERTKILLRKTNMVTSPPILLNDI